MADPTDPEAVEEQSQAEQENYRVYRRRWLVLFAMFSVNLAVGLHKSLISVADILERDVDMGDDQYKLVEQVSMYTTLVSVVAMARALDHFGLRRVSYVACLMIIAANCLKAVCFATHLDYANRLVAPHRYLILLASEAFVGLAWSIGQCVPAKVASNWFAHYESTLALVIANCGYNIGVGFSNYFTPIFVRTPADMFKLSYLFLASAGLVSLVVVSCVTRSSPKVAPSSSALSTPTSCAPLRSGIALMLRQPSYALLLVTLALNTSCLMVEQLVLESILASQGYSDAFCGTLIAHAYFLGTFFMLMGAAWVDNSANYVQVSRIAAVICALSICAFNASVVVPNIKNVILVSNVLASFGASLMYPALFQVALRSATGVLAEATVAAIVVVLQQCVSGALMNLLGPLRALSAGGYQAPLVLFSLLVLASNVVYAARFRPANREKLRARLRSCADRELLMNQEASDES